MDRERNQPNAYIWLETANSLHQTNRPLLNQIRERQAVTEVAAGDPNHEPQMGQHQPARGHHVALVAEAERELALLVQG